MKNYIHSNSIDAKTDLSVLANHTTTGSNNCIISVVEIEEDGVIDEAQFHVSSGHNSDSEFNISVFNASFDVLESGTILGQAPFEWVGVSFDPIEVIAGDIVYVSMQAKRSPMKFKKSTDLAGDDIKSLTRFSQYDLKDISHVDGAKEIPDQSFATRLGFTPSDSSDSNSKAIISVDNNEGVVGTEVTINLSDEGDWTGVLELVDTYDNIIPLTQVDSKTLTFVIPDPKTQAHPSALYNIEELYILTNDGEILGTFMIIINPNDDQVIINGLVGSHINPDEPVEVNNDRYLCHGDTIMQGYDALVQGPDSVVLSSITLGLGVSAVESDQTFIVWYHNGTNWFGGSGKTIAPTVIDEEEDDTTTPPVDDEPDVPNDEPDTLEDDNDDIKFSIVKKQNGKVVVLNEDGTEYDSFRDVHVAQVSAALLSAKEDRKVTVVATEIFEVELK